MTRRLRTTQKIPTTSRPSRRKRMLIGALVLVLLAPFKALAGLTEYALILALIAILVVVAPLQLPLGSEPVLNELQSSFQAAQNANSTANTRRELSSLGKGIGLAEALMGMSASCDGCSELRTDVQAIIGLASKLRARLLTGGTCNPNGVIGPGESCDPLADPTGCPVSSIPTFCDDQCFCEAIVTSTTTTSTSTTTIIP